LTGAIVTGMAVWLLSDRTWFTGDFILRLGTLGGPIAAEKIFPQALPLDLFMHVTLPRFVARLSSIDVGSAEYAFGVIKAAALGALAVEFARLLRLRGVVALAAATIVAAGGYLGMLTGCGQAFGDMCLIVAAVGVFGLRMCLTGTGLAPFSISVALGFCMHREALALMPAWATIVYIRWPSLRRLDRRRSVREIAWLSLPLATLAAMAPRIVHLMLGFDRSHLVSTGTGPGGFSWALDPQRLLDLLNLMLRLSPLAIAVPLLAWLLAPRLRRRTDAAFMLALVVPWLLGMLLVHPEDQGLVRDWGTFAAAGLVVSLCLSWLVAEAIRDAPTHAWLGVALAIGCAVPTVEQLLVSHDPSWGMRRVNAYIDESPRRPDAHRTLALDYLGTRYRLLGNADESARAFERAANITPARRVLYNWALAEADGGHYQRAREILERLIASGGATPDAFYTLGAVSYLLGDRVAARKAVLQTLALAPSAPAARQLLARIDSTSSTAAAVRP
jgi:tetratricopeptide (TPR) repeat protein